MKKLKIIAITGATGLIGKSVLQAFLKEGYRVQALSREKMMPTDLPCRWIQGSITDSKAMHEVLQGAQALVHLAGQKSDEKDSREVNVGGAKNIIHIAKEIGLKKIVNISTQSVRLQKKGVYAKTKAEAEKLFEESGLSFITLRPSVVYNDEGGGIIKTIQEMIQLPFVPMIGSGEITLRPIHVDDLATIIVASIQNDNLKDTYDIGGPDNITLLHLVKKIMKTENIQRKIIHLPTKIALVLAMLTSWMKKPLITASNVLGAMENLPFSIEDMKKDFKVIPKNIDETLKRIRSKSLEKAKRQEAIALLQYPFSSWEKIPIENALIERYMNALNMHGIQEEENMHPFILQSPFLLGILERAKKKDSPLRKKILIASAIMETTTKTASYSLPKNRSILQLFGETMWFGTKGMFMNALGLLLQIFSVEQSYGKE